MSDFEVQRKKLNVKIYDKVYELNKPKNGQVEEVLEALEKDGVKSSDNFKMMKEFMVHCGLPAEVISDMDHDDFQALCEFVISASKKKSVKNG